MIWHSRRYNRDLKADDVAPLDYIQEERVASPFKPASQVAYALGPVPGPLHSLADPAPRLVPEGDGVHGIAAAPVEITAVGCWISVKEEQVVSQGGGTREVVHVDEGTAGHKALVIGTTGAQHHRYRPSQQRVAPELLGDIIQMLRVLESQVELVAGHRLQQPNVRHWPPGSTLAEHVHGHVLAELVIVADPGLALIPVAHHPGHQPAFPGQRGDQAWRLVAGMGPGVQVTIRHEDVRVGPVGERPVKEMTCQVSQSGGVGG